MRIPRIYTSQILASDSDIELEAGPSHHLLKVLRMSVGRELILFNGNGGEYPSEIVQSTKKTATIRVKSERQRPNSSPLQSELGIGISKGDRFDWVVQKATELGVSDIHPLITERSEIKLSQERALKKMASWQQIIISACEQCQRNTLPNLHAPVNLQEFTANSEAEQKFVLHHRTDRSLASIAPPSSVSLLIGPEGGLSDSEIAEAEKNQFSSLRVGPRVLRTETAPLAALSIIQHLWGDC